jgi:hypothetical protein
MEIHDNILDAIDGAAGYCGQIMTAITGWNKGIKYYNNKSYTPETNGTQWNFHLETWNCKGGWEIYDNEFYGGGVGVDIAGTLNIKGTYDYSFYIHDNLFQRAATQPINMSRESVAIAIEGATADVIITKNLFKYCQFGVTLSLAQASITQERIYVYYNIFENTGVTNNDWGGPFQIRLSANNDVVDSIFYENNVMTASPEAASGAYAGLLVSMDNNDTGQSITNIFVRNNIIEGFLNGPIAIYDTTVVTSLTNTHNIVYNNGNSNDIHYYNGQSSVTSYTVSDTLKRDPDFISTTNFRLQASSPAINAGTDVSLTSDYDGNPIVGIVDIGAFEYQTLPVATTGLGWEDILSKRNFKDDVNLKQSRWMIDGVPVTASAPELNALVGSGEIISGLDTISLSNRIDLKLDIADTATLSTRIDLKADTVDQSFTGTTNISQLQVGNEASNRALPVDSLVKKDGNYALYEGATQLAPSIPVGEYQELTDIIWLKEDSLASRRGYYTQRQVDSLAAIKANIDNQTHTGTTVISKLNIGSAASATKAEFDSCVVYNNHIYCFIGGDTVGVGTLEADKIYIEDVAVMLIDTTGIFVFGAGSGADADSTLFAINSKAFGSFYNYTDTLYVVNMNVLYLTTGDSLRFNCYYGNRMTGVATDSLFNAIQPVGVNQNILTPNDRKIPPDKDVWIKMSGTQLAGYRPKQFEIQLNGYVIRDH